MKRVLDERSNSPESPIGQKASKNGSSTQHKRIRMMSDSDSENGSPVKKGTDLAGKTSELEEKLAFLKNACPNVDTMVLQDTLKAHNWKVDWALETLTKKQKPAKNKLKAHHVMEDNSESDDDEFTGKGLVYDSDEEKGVEVLQRGRRAGDDGDSGLQQEEGVGDPEAEALRGVGGPGDQAADQQGLECRDVELRHRPAEDEVRGDEADEQVSEDHGEDGGGGGPVDGHRRQQLGDQAAARDAQPRPHPLRLPADRAQLAGADAQAGHQRHLD